MNFFEIKIPHVCPFLFLPYCDHTCTSIVPFGKMPVNERIAAFVQMVEKLCQKDDNCLMILWYRHATMIAIKP